jgi:hypothetical protein
MKCSAASVATSYAFPLDNCHPAGLAFAPNGHGLTVATAWLLASVKHRLGVIDAAANKLVQKTAIKGGHPHSVASDDASWQVYLPVGTV